MTLIELIVVVAIVGILLALVLVAVQAARERSRRLTCQNNLRQIGLALANYESSARAWPAGVIWEPRGEPLSEGVYPIGLIDRVARYGDLERDTIYANWLVALLPFLEQVSVAGDSRRLISAEENRAVREADLAVLKCPSDSNARPGAAYERGGAAGLRGNKYARGNYAINVGPDNGCVPMENEEFPCVNGFYIRGHDLAVDVDQVWGSGIAGVNRSFSPRDVADGLSSTVAVDEIVSGAHRWDPRGAWALGQIGASGLARHGEYESAGGPNATYVAGGDAIIGCGAIVADGGEHLLSGEGLPCIPEELAVETNGWGVARSRHPGGVSLLYCDGSVQFVENSIAIGVWHAIHTRNRGELVSAN